MTVLRLSIALDPAQLLARATRGLFPLAASTVEEPWPTLSSWLVLRQGGMRDDLHRLAANANIPGWFDPPVCLVNELPARWGVPGAPPLANEERIALLTAVVSRHADGVFDRAGSADAWIPAIDRLIGELLSEGISADAYRTALASRVDRDAFEQQRDDRLAAIYSDWIFALRQNARSDTRNANIRLADFINNRADDFARQLRGRRDIRIVGLADLRGGWHAMLDALARCPHVDTVTLFASHALEIPPSLDVVIEPDDGAPALAAALFTDVDPVTIGTLRLLEAPDAAREMEQVAVRVRALLDEGITSPERVAVVVRQARPGVDRMADALETLGVPITARRRTALSQTGPAKALRALLNTATEGFTRHSVVEVAEHPLLALTLDADVLQAAGAMAPITSADAWEPALTQLVARCAQRDATPADWRAHGGLPATAQATLTLASWRAWLPQARDLTSMRTDSEWFDWVQNVLTLELWGVASRLDHAPAGDERVWKADVNARAQIIGVALEWTRALRELQVVESPCGAESFARRLSLVLDADLITQPETGFGVVVAEALAAAWRAFDHVFVVGLSAGEFPRRPSPSALLSERDRRALIAAGLPLDPPERWRLREQELFRVLCAAPSGSLTLSWPSMDNEGREVARSSFVDDVVDIAMAAHGAANELQLEALGVLTRIPAQQVFTPGFPVVARGLEVDALHHARIVAAIEGVRARALSPYNGRIESSEQTDALQVRFGESFVWSATQLETLAKCGWSWFASRLLKLDERSDLDEGMEATTRGTLLHDALDRFFAYARTHFGGPPFLRASDIEWSGAALARALDGAWTALAPTTWLGNPALLELVRAELLAQLIKYVDFEIGQNEKSYDNRTKPSKQIRMAALEGERAFDHVHFESGGVHFLLRGAVDRVDIGVDDRIGNAAAYLAAIDYKSSKYSTPAAGDKRGWDDGVVLQVPLYARALQQLYPDHRLARLEYRTLKRPEAIHTLELHKLETVGKGKSASKAVVANDADETRLDEALAHAARRVLQARDGAFAADPVQSCGCSPYCVARDICRIPGGPVDV